MNKKLPKESLYDYIKTIGVSLFITTIFVLFATAILKYQVYEDLTTQTYEEDIYEPELINYMIEKNKIGEEKNPKNYKINLKLGILYEVLGDYQNAEANYKMAILKKPFNEYTPDYKLANLYIRTDRIKEAQEIMDSIKERPNKYLIGYKADIYKSLGDIYYQRKDYENAIIRYQKALMYASLTKSKQINHLKNNLASSYSLFADEEVMRLDINSAVNSLEKALEQVNAPILKYKLAILLMNKKPEKAYMYFEEVFKTEPNIINFKEYHKFLLQLQTQAEMIGDKPQAKLYGFKIKKVKDYFEKNVLYFDDLKIEDVKTLLSYNKWNKKYSIKLHFKIKNMTKSNMNHLYLQLAFKDNNGLFLDKTKPVAEEDSPLKAFSEPYTININLKKTKKDWDISPKKIKVDIFAAKSTDSYRLKLTTIEISEDVKPKKTFPVIEKIKYILLRIME